MPQPQPHTESTIETWDDALEALQRSWPTFVIERRFVLGSELHYQAFLYHCLRARMHTDRRCHHIAERRPFRVLYAATYECGRRWPTLEPLHWALPLFITGLP